MRTRPRTLLVVLLLAVCLMPGIATAQGPGTLLRLPLIVTSGGHAQPPTTPEPPATPLPPTTPEPPATAVPGETPTPNGSVTPGITPGATPAVTPGAPPTVPPSTARSYPRVHAPRFDGEVAWEQTGIFWLGRITPSENGVDVRVGYTDDALFLRLSVFDRLQWYDASLPVEDLTAWDAATVYLDMNEAPAAGIAEGTRRLVAQLRWSESDAAYQATYRGANGAWQSVDLGATSDAAYRGEGAPNSGQEGRGWVLNWRIPFSGLGLSGRPADGAQWGLAVAVHDRDAGSGGPNPDVVWPRAMAPGDPRTWGALSFGLPASGASDAAPDGVITVRQGLNGASVPDGHVGGGAVCGDGLDYWSAWGDANYAGAMPVNVQNQSDVADWPCFSRYYVTFPLDAVPAGKEVLSATLTLRQMGASQPDQAVPSLIQAFVVSEDWNESTLTWNNAPQAKEDVARTWVDPIVFPDDWSALPARTWDVTRAVAEAVAAGQPLRLALYSADSAYHSGRHFVPSDTEDWNAANRPTLTIAWGE